MCLNASVCVNGNTRRGHELPSGRRISLLWVDELKGKHFMLDSFSLLCTEEINV